MYDEIQRECHPLLKGGRDEDYRKGSFCSSDMETLTSICEVIVQPLTFNNSLNDLHHHGNNMDQSIHSFSAASGSHYPVPNKVRTIVY